MEEYANSKEEVFTKIVRAGKRTYFFDVKETKGGERYITITESKRHYDDGQDKFTYEKHKVFLYKEDFEKFAKGLDQVVRFIETGVMPEADPKDAAKDEFHGIDFEA